VALVQLPFTRLTLKRHPFYNGVTNRALGRLRTLYRPPHEQVMRCARASYLLAVPKVVGLW
jgi:hypothetical protein